MSKLGPSVAALLLCTLPALACPEFPLSATADLSHPLGMPFFHQGTRVRFDFKGQVTIEIDKEDRAIITLPSGKVVSEMPRVDLIVRRAPNVIPRPGIAPGTVVGTWVKNPSDAGANWFVIGAHAILTAPSGGAFLNIAVYDTDGHDNSGAYTGFLMLPDPADWNADGSINSLDFMAYLNAYLAGDADFNRDTVTDSSDLFAFLEDYLNQVPSDPPPPDGAPVDPPIAD